MDWEDVEDVNQADDSNEIPTEHAEPVTRPAEQPADPIGNQDDGDKYKEGEEKYKEGEEGHEEFVKEQFNSNQECLTCKCQKPGAQRASK